MVIGVSIEGLLTPPQGGVAKDPITTDISYQLCCSVPSIAKTSEGHCSHSASCWVMVLSLRSKTLYYSIVEHLRLTT